MTSRKMFVKENTALKVFTIFMQPFIVKINRLHYKNVICYKKDSLNPKDTIDNDIFMLPHLIITETNVNGELLEPDTEFVVTMVQYQPGVDGSIQQGDI